MFCKGCLRKNMQVYYKLNSKYIDLMETITEVKMKLNDFVCCFCLATLQKIEKFTVLVQEVDSILQQSIKIEEKINEVTKYHNLVVSTNKNISIGCSRERDELLKQVERDLVKKEEIEDDPLQLSEGTIIDNETDSENDVSAITITVIKEDQNESTNGNEAVSPKLLKRTSIKQENNIVVRELPGNVVKQNIIRKRRNNIDVLSHDVKEKIANEISKRNYINTIRLSDKPFSCDTCAFRARDKSDLTRHLRTHTGEKPFTCNICLHKFSNKSNLIKHLRTHTGEKPFSCNICSFICSRQSTLGDHLRTHSGEKPFSCSICFYKCSRQGSLRLHLRTHTGEKPFSCNICSYKSKTTSALRVHLRTHTGEKPFSCNICSYKCSTKTNLDRHLSIHTDEKPFSCDICAHKTKIKSDLKSHILNRHMQ